jgi:hypothetical protein
LRSYSNTDAPSSFKNFLSLSGPQLAFAWNAFEQYQRFGKLRNTIIHFAVPNQDFASETLQFLFQVMEPLVRRFWGKSILPYAGEWDDVTVAEGYLEEQLLRCNIEITPELRAALDAEKADN